MHGHFLRTALKWVGATYALLLAQCSLRYAPYACRSNAWELLTHCFGTVLLTLCSLCLSFKRICQIPYAMFLMLLCQMRGCYLRTAFCLVLLTLCSLCLYMKCVDAFYALLCAPYAMFFYLYFKAVGATYALLLAQCSVRYAPYACMSNEWVLLTHCFLRYVPYAFTSNAWVLLTHCYWHSVPYAMFLMLVF